MTTLMPAALPSSVRSWLPFVSVAALAIGLVAVDPDRPGELLLATGLLGGACLLQAWPTVGRSRGLLGTGPALVFLVGVGVLRDAAGGALGGVGVLVFVPVLWTALHGTRRQLALVVGAMVAVWVWPLIVVGAPAYPSTGWRGAALLVSVCAVLGSVVGRLTALARHEAAQRAEVMARLRVLADTDPLTGVWNRRAWTTRLGRTLSERGGEQPVTVALIDLDGLKAINDARGHAAGDDLLRGAASAWRHRLGPGDLLARVGGDEFAVLLPGRSAAQATAVVDELRGLTPWQETCSAGVAQAEPDEDAARLLERADAALYVAKASGRNLTVAADAAPKHPPGWLPRVLSGELDRPAGRVQDPAAQSGEAYPSGRSRDRSAERPARSGRGTGA